uniref:Uncharacterized protein n=1 Tax=Meloidogyne enterolobii TaxID=390850 RepID=A0A6V7VC85_MELEN|nr:unnamed protein product [Meloidogyne enterolobii]
MKIARYLFQLLFNCSFDYFQIYLGIINPQMIEVLFVDEIATNMPLQIHSQRAETCLREEHYLNFAWNHLVSNRFCIDIDDRFEEKNLAFLFKILANGANKFSAVTYQHLNTKLYNLIIKHIETSQDVAKMVKEIEFDTMYGPLISSERAKNIEVTVENELKTTKFQLVNKHNPKIEFSICIKEGGNINMGGYAVPDLIPAVVALIKRIN